MLDSDDEQAQLIREFLLECGENLDALDRDFASLGDDPTNLEALSGIFRSFHTIQGTAGFFGFQKLASVARAAESLSVALRSGRLAWSADLLVALRQGAVMLRRILSSIAATRVEGDLDCGMLIAQIERLERPDRDR